MLLATGEGGTQLTFTHEGVPVEYHYPIKQGWHDYYWKPMKKLLDIVTP
ncbi:MAG: SRPBCC domain-containing protein [Vulcanimicrobiota bacterium]